MSITVDHNEARAVLEKAWREIGASTRPPARMQQLIENVLTASDVTFKYILVTGYLGKCVNPEVHSRALQVSSTLPGAYDARSLCHKVVVGFEKTKGNLFGLSNEPFVNKPARHTEHRGDNPQLRNKASAQRLHDALEQAQKATAEEVFRGLVHILRIGAAHAADQQSPIVPVRLNLHQVMTYTKLFLQQTDGGARLVAIWGAFTALLSENGIIKVYSPNTADLYGKTAGDVEVYYNDCLVSASECKQRPVTLDDIKHGLRKCKERGLAEYNFVYSQGLERGKEAAIKTAIKDSVDACDVTLINIWDESELLAAMLNPVRRASFGTVVVELLRAMRKFESANQAADLWNSVTSQKQAED